MLPMILAAFLATAAHGCPTFFAGGATPVAPGAQLACEDGYAVGYVTAWGEPAWSAEVITAASAQAGEAAKRNGAFHECALPDGSMSVAPKAYLHTGYDLGHMTPAGDRGADKPTTFCTLNMVPQQPNLNRKIWAHIEGSLRALAIQGATLYVVTGPVIAPDAARIGGAVSVPERTFKAVLVEGKGAAAWDCSNIPAPVCVQESIAVLRAEIPYDPFPNLGPDAEAVAIALPAVDGFGPPAPKP